ncbi:MAG TPA: hypothetical protein VFT64_09845 [Rickettsiales bacterium]|nr:hypothetical protein [Rickettsiales bacterium]
MLRKVRYLFEAIILLLGLAFFRLLPLDVASSLGGRLARILGPLSGAHRTAAKNLEMAFPDISPYRKHQILRGMWDNMGRVIGEYPHLSRPIMRRRITVDGLEYLGDIKQSGKGAFFASGHFANWEIIPLTAAIHNMPMALIYRAANNPFVDKVIRRIRSPYSVAMYPKGRGGALSILKEIKSGRSVGMLVDQKLNDGLPVKFFGREAMTATAVISLAAKMQVPVFMVRVVRTHGVHFHVSVEAPRHYAQDVDPVVAMQELHTCFENWIREYPSQWFWVHRRWGK